MAEGTRCNSSPAAAKLPLREMESRTSKASSEILMVAAGKLGYDFKKITDSSVSKRIPPGFSRFPKTCPTVRCQRGICRRQSFYDQSIHPQPAIDRNFSEVRCAYADHS